MGPKVQQAIGQGLLQKCAKAEGIGSYRGFCNEASRVHTRRSATALDSKDQGEPLS